VETTDPLRITIAAPVGCTGRELADMLREKKIECEYADGEYIEGACAFDNLGLLTEIFEEEGKTFRVRRVRRISNASAWNKAGREEQIYSRF